MRSALTALHSFGCSGCCAGRGNRLPRRRGGYAIAAVLAVAAGLVGSLGAAPAPLADAQARGPSVVALVPAANWRQTSSEKLATDAVARWGGDPAVESEFGVKQVEHRTYQLENKPAGAVQCDVVIEEAADPSSAYGLLTYYHNEGMAPEKGLPLVEGGATGGVAARGLTFVRFVKPDALLSDDDFRALVILVAGMRPSIEATAALPAQILPPEGLVAGSERYVLGPEVARRVLPGFAVDLIGFAQGAEVQIGSYSNDAGSKRSARSRSIVVAISYPNFQIARQRFDQMEKALSLNHERAGGLIAGRRQSSFVVLVLNAESEVAATRLLDLFKFEEQVSWDQRYQSEKSIVRQLFEIIVSNLLLVCILVGLAVAGGLLIALSRRLARAWFPKSEWGSREGDRLITLNLR